MIKILVISLFAVISVDLIKLINVVYSLRGLIFASIAELYISFGPF